MPFPAKGNDFLAFIEYRSAKDFGIEFRVKRNSKPSLVDSTDAYGRMVHSLVARRQTNCRLTIDFVSTRSMGSSSRIEWTQVAYGNGAGNGNGLLLSQSIWCKPLKKFDVFWHIGLFHTDSYDSRVYEYERDVPGTSSNPALFGRGYRWYIIARYHYTSHFFLSAKYSQTVKEGITSFGSGPDEIQGDMLSQVSVQIDVRL